MEDVSYSRYPGGSADFDVRPVYYADKPASAAAFASAAASPSDAGVKNGCGGGAGAEGDYHPGCYPSLVAGSYPRDRLESHRVEGRPP